MPFKYLIIVIITVFIGCNLPSNSGTPDPDEPIVEITSVSVYPDTTIIGDKVFINCIISNYEPDLSFIWVIKGYPSTIVTQRCELEIEALIEGDNINTLSVNINNTFSDQEFFRFFVIN
jgi:hypothetical protein